MVVAGYSSSGKIENGLAAPGKSIVPIATAGCHAGVFRPGMGLASKSFLQ